jgi:hypothetical protein
LSVCWYIITVGDVPSSIFDLDRTTLSENDTITQKMNDTSDAVSLVESVPATTEPATTVVDKGTKKFLNLLDEARGAQPTTATSMEQLD